MRAAIIQCDSVLTEFVPQFGTYTDMIMHMFEPANANIEFEIYDAQNEQYPEDIESFDFFITTGSKAAVYDDDPWIKKLIAFVEQLDIQKKKLIGICFGHQIIAMARQGKVEVSSKGWGVGISTNKVLARPMWMNDSKSELNIIVSHKDQITDLPDDTLVIATSDFCPYFVVQWGEHILSIQGHPEFLPDYSKALINHRKNILGEKITETGLASLATRADSNLFTRWILDFVAYN